MSVDPTLQRTSMNFPTMISRALAIGCLATSLAAHAEEAAPAAPAPVRAQAEARVVVQAVPADAPAVQVNEGVLRIEAGANIQGEVRVMGGGQLIIQQGAGPVVIQEGGFFVGEGAPPAAPAAEKKAEVAETEDRVDFLNKDRLRGTLDAIRGSDGILLWRHADSTNAIPFKTAGINRVRMAPRVPGPASSNFLSSVTLTNDDYLTGRLVSLDADKLVLETEHLGTLNLERIMVRSFSPNSKFSALLYSGPTDLEGWNLGGRNSANSWIASNGALVPLMQFPITREIEGLPDQSRMTFTADWKAYPAFNFGFGAAKARGDMFGESGYNLMVSGNSIYFRRTTATEGSDNLWNINSDELGRSGNRKAVFELFIDRKKAAFTLFLNGKQIKQWTDAKGYAGKGNHISFQSQVQGGLRFTGIRVAAWDGVLPDPKEDTAPAATLDGIWFVNRDRIEGSVLAIREGRAHVKSELTGEVEIPLERISEIHLAPESRERARRNKGDVRMSLLGGVTLTADVRELAAGVITASSENFNQVRIPLPRVQEMEFNIYRRKPAADVVEPESDIPVWVE
jgi:hypothetical protein